MQKDFKTNEGFLRYKTICSFANYNRNLYQNVGTLLAVCNVDRLTTQQ
jgi:hypothetical protein